MDSQWGEGRAIETRFRGHRFRSRLEARWAVFFDALAIRWVYEIEGFDLDGTWYLPDFWLPDLGWWAEVKPALAFADRRLKDEATRRIVLLAGRTQRPAVLLEGGFDPIEIDAGGGYSIGAPDGKSAAWDMGCQWAECLSCGDVGIADGGLRTFLRCGHHALGTTDFLAAAYGAAGEARFEKGGR